MMKYLLPIIACYFLLFYTSVKAQNNDSLINILNNTKSDSTYIHTSLDLAWSYMYSNSDSAEYFANKALVRSEDRGMMLRLANSYNTLGVVYIVKAEYYEALSYLSKGLDIGNQLLSIDSSKYQYKRRVMAIYTNMGNIYYFKGKYDDAVNSYLMALKLAEEIGYLEGAAVCSSNLGSAYKDLYNYPKALEYNYKALAFANETGDRFSLSQSYNNLGSVYFSVPNYDSAYYYFFIASKMNEEDNDEYELINNYVNLGDVMRDIGKYDSALYYYEKSLNFSEKLQSADGLINCNYMIGQLYHKKEQFNKSISYYKKSLSLAKKAGMMRFIMLSSEQISVVYKQIGNYNLAYDYFVSSAKIRDSIFNADSDARIADMEAKYKSEKKEEQIKLLTKKGELQRATAKVSRVIFISVIIILILFIVLIIISYRSFKFKQLSEKQRIQQEAEHEVLDAIMDTENKERKRFAEDLHDGLGVMLSTLRLYINEIDNDTTSDERKSLIKQSNGLLDDAIQNARNISNNIMPAALKDNGLIKSVKSFSDKINSSGNILIEVKSLNVENRLKNSIEITLYRVITELINNTLKHAMANNITITFTKKNDLLIITYSDDGKGFDYDEMIVSDKKGMGLMNIKSRIKSIGGKCNMKSEPQNGYYVVIEVMDKRE